MDCFADQGPGDQGSSPVWHAPALCQVHGSAATDQMYPMGGFGGARGTSPLPPPPWGHTAQQGVPVPRNEKTGTTPHGCRSVPVVESGGEEPARVSGVSVQREPSPAPPPPCHSHCHTKTVGGGKFLLRPRAHIRVELHLHESGEPQGGYQGPDAEPWPWCHPLIRGLWAPTRWRRWGRARDGGDKEERGAVMLLGPLGSPTAVAPALRLRQWRPHESAAAVSAAERPHAMTRQRRWKDSLQTYTHTPRGGQGCTPAGRGGHRAGRQHKGPSAGGRGPRPAALERPGSPTAGKGPVDVGEVGGVRDRVADQALRRCGRIACLR